jgi:hypothetical protein
MQILPQTTQFRPPETDHQTKKEAEEEMAKVMKVPDFQQVTFKFQNFNDISIWNQTGSSHQTGFEPILATRYEYRHSAHVPILGCSNRPEHTPTNGGAGCRSSESTNETA